MNNIGGFGLKIFVNASVTFPIGFLVTQFADDGDPFDVPNIQIRDKAMGLNGDLVSWGKAQPVNIKISLIPDSQDDINFTILAKTNKVGLGRNPVNDVINMVGTYPDGSVVVLTNGVMTDAPLGSSVASSGRMKSKEYSFSFENNI
jgi:hypothetical protein